METRYVSGSGSAHTDCCFIGYRFDLAVGFRPGEIESWVMRGKTLDNGAPGTGVQYGAARWYTGLWRSRAGTVYVCDGDGEVHINPTLSAPDANLHWKRHPLQASLFGIFGLDEQNVWTWGQRKITTGVMFRWNGEQWSEIPAPDFDVAHVHGTSPNTIFAVGRSGGIAHWDGSSWRRWSCPVSESLNAVWVVSEDEIYATGDAGSLLEGSKHGWAKIAQGPGPGLPLRGVAKWKDHLWVGGGSFGLLRRAGKTEQLEVYKEKIRAIGFDARENLLVTADDVVWASIDGVGFKGTGRDVLLTQRAGKALLDVT